MRDDRNADYPTMYRPQVMAGMSKKSWLFAVVCGLGGWAMFGAIVYWGVKGF